MRYQYPKDTSNTGKLPSPTYTQLPKTAPIAEPISKEQQTEPAKSLITGIFEIIKYLAVRIFWLVIALIFLYALLNGGPRYGGQYPYY